MKASIFSIIVTYNAEPWLNMCLDSLLKSSVPLDDIIVIDNNSTDRTTEIIQNNYPSVRLIKKQENLGFGKANNIGLSLAKAEGADYVFLLNQDAWIEENTLENIVSVLENNEEYGLLSPMHLNGDGTSLDYNFERYLCESSNNKLFSDIYTGKVKKETPYEVDFVNAAAWLLTSSCINKVGGFDPIYHLYGEDADFVKRLKYHGFKIGVVPDSVIYHGRIIDKSGANNGNTKRQLMNGLVLLKDINKSFYKCFIDFTGYCIKNLFKGLFYGDFVSLRYGITSLARFSIRIPKILRHRKLSKNSSGLFL